MANTHETSASSGGSKVALVATGAVLIVVGVLLHGQAEHSESIKAITQPAMFAGLGLDFAKVLTNVGLFLLFIQVIAAFFFAPLKEAIDSRNNELEQTFTDADALRARLESMKTDYESRIAATEASAREHIEAQIKEAQKLRQTLMNEAATRADAMIEKAQQEIAAERAKLLADIRTQVVELSLVAAEKIVGENMDDARNRKLVTEFVDNLEVKR